MARPPGPPGLQSGCVDRWRGQPLSEGTNLRRGNSAVKPQDDRVYLLHICDAIARIFEFTKDGKEYFMSDRRTQDAVIRNIEIIGEAVKNLSRDLRGAYPEVPWRTIGGIRDKVIHDYF